MGYRQRIVAFIALDSIIVLTAIFFSYFLLHPTLTVYSLPTLILSAITLLISHHIAAYFFHLYDRIWSVASVSELLTIVYAVTISVGTASLMQYAVQKDIYFRVMAVTWMIHIIAIGGSRFALRVFSEQKMTNIHEQKNRALIVGAGQAGTILAKQMKQSINSDLIPVAFVDDDLNKQKLKMLDIPVKGTVEDIPKIVEELTINHIIIAIPSLTKKDIQEIFEHCSKTKAKVKIMPSIEAVMTGKLSVSEMREVKIEDLLGREEVKLDMEAISEKLTNKTILVTGAGGSIGSEICRQIIKFHPRKLILLGHGENTIYTIDMELRQKVPLYTEIIPVIADIQDRNRIFDIVSEFKPNVIYHAAAHKHVPLMEYNPMEAVKNNIYGTKNVAEAADTFGVDYFVMISTDKAVNPPNIMGATKRFAEMIIQNLAKSSNTKFAAVRFGNVLGSRGSVVPLFKKQIAAGGPVTITDVRMTRYFMTIPEASRLVIQAGTLASGGEVFVLDMGEPVKVVDLARKLIRLSGYTEEEIGIIETGIRPGEKLYEELMNESEKQSEVIYPKIYVGKSTPMASSELIYLLNKIPSLSVTELKELLIDKANKKNVDIKNKIKAIQLVGNSAKDMEEIK
ncbi:nucleoside-diphosphate sugar epimerase/dehydratase [Bacillus sp. Cr_A10]|uniref:polysaccharide biosynthesis protein n=1 Tax=Bacillus sp. Cr_A10 TaxID=3033993 RepID=UPI0023DB7B91|nr:nucleoside-diphosphate sugar epimerase/dehydratase [Bacillus sp. Cr_A10]MDF2068162.1 nucleoside-diphosphate sugar epimerase/dehydratase [Bacillus sp. Cr_A10]